MWSTWHPPVIPPLPTPDRSPDRDRELRTDHLLADIKGRSIRGGMVMFAGQGIRLGIQFAAVIVLSRLLPPTAFGLIAMVAAITAVLDLLKELGLSAATMQRPQITHEQVTALFWINTAAGGAIMVLLFAAAPLIATFYGQPDLIGVTRILACVFLISGLGNQHWALLRRQMRFTSITVIETGAEFAAFLVAISAALAGAGFWALVAQRVTSPLLMMIGSWTCCRWRPGLPKRTAGVRDMFDFGMSYTIGNIGVAATRSLDQILIGWLWGPALLGLYERATRLVQVPLNNINAPVYAVAMPTLSRLTDQPERYRRGFCEIIEKLAMMTMPAGILAAAMADWVVSILLGRGWEDATTIIGSFAVIAAYQPTIATVMLLYMTHGRSRAMLVTMLLDSAVTVVTILFAVPFGGTMVAGALAVTGLLLRMPLRCYMATRHSPVSLGDLLATLAPSIAAAAAAGAAAIAMRLLVREQGFSDHLQFAATAAAGVLAVVLTFVLIPRSRRTLLGLARMSRYVGTRNPSAVKS